MYVLYINKKSSLSSLLEFLLTIPITDLSLAAALTHCVLSIDFCRARPSCGNQPHVAAVYWLPVDGTDRRTDGRTDTRLLRDAYRWKRSASITVGYGPNSVTWICCRHSDSTNPQQIQVMEFRPYAVMISRPRVDARLS